MLQHTPLEDAHRRLGATMVEFAGFHMPLHYGSIRDEHLAVRQRAGLFDVSHMGEVRVSGPGAGAFVQRMVVSDTDRLGPGRACYTLLCRPDGGIVDDLLVYRAIDDAGSASYLLVVNAARRERDLDWLEANRPADGVVLDDQSLAVALLALQGPRALPILDPLTAIRRPADARLGGLGPFHAADATVAGVEALVSRTGYTGEDGFECYCRAEDAPRIWDALLEAGRPHGLVPAGLGARDTLRLEAGLRLYGQDMDETVDPYTCGLGWTVRLEKAAFVGRSALEALAAGTRARHTVGLRLGPRAIPRHGQVVRAGGHPVGQITSGGFGFSTRCGIALATVDSGLARPGEPVAVELRGADAAAEVVALPFYRRPSA